MDAGHTGFDELRFAMNALTGPEVKKAVAKGLRSGGKIQLAAAKALAPKRFGTLRKALILRVGKRNRKGTKSVYVRVDPKKAEMFKSLSGTVSATSVRGKAGKGNEAGTKYFYPAAQEFGWTAGGRRYPGTPYLRPAFDGQKERITAIIEKTTWQMMQKVWGKKANG